MKVIFSILILFTFFNSNILAKKLDCASLHDSPLRFVVYCDDNTEQIIQNADGYFKSFLDAYNLEIVNTFEIDAENKGFTLEVKTGTVDANELAKEISMMRGIIMVEVQVGKTPKCTS